MACRVLTKICVNHAKLWASLWMGTRTSVIDCWGPLIHVIEDNELARRTLVDGGTISIRKGMVYD